MPKPGLGWTFRRSRRPPPSRTVGHSAPEQVTDAQANHEGQRQQHGVQVRTFEGDRVPFARLFLVERLFLGRAPEVSGSAASSSSGGKVSMVSSVIGANYTMRPSTGVWSSRLPDWTTPTISISAQILAAREWRPVSPSGRLGVYSVTCRSPFPSKARTSKVDRQSPLPSARFRRNRPPIQWRLRSRRHTNLPLPGHLFGLKVTARCGLRRDSAARGRFVREARPDSPTSSMVYCACECLLCLRVSRKMRRRPFA